MPDRPHIVLIMADHLRRDAIDCYAPPGPRTPHLGALARESVIFDNAYCSTPLCIPTRMSMYTGKWPHSTGVIVNGGNYQAEIPYRTLGPQHRTLYEHLADAGYQLLHMGAKPNDAQPSLQERAPSARLNPFPPLHEVLRQQGLDPAISHTLVKDYRQPCPEYDDGRMVVKMFPSPKGIDRYPYPLETFPDVYLASQIERLIDELDPAQPQFLQALFWAPHPPLVIPEPYFSMYDPASIPLPPTVGRWQPDQPATLLAGFAGAMGAQLMPQEWTPVWAAHFALVSLVDDCIGRVVAALKRKGIWDNALVVFVQDHGEMLGCHGLWEKHCCYQESVHLPLLIKPPGHSATAGPPPRRDQLTGHIDFADTVCDYAGVQRLPGSQGRSLRPVIEHAGTPWRQEQFVEYNGNHGRGTPMRSVVARVDDRLFKYIHNPGGIDELYDLHADPLETRSLLREVEHQPVARDLRRRLSKWMSETGDFLSPPAQEVNALQLSS